MAADNQPLTKVEAEGLAAEIRANADALTGGLGAEHYREELKLAKAEIAGLLQLIAEQEAQIGRLEARLRAARGG